MTEPSDDDKNVTSNSHSNAVAHFLGFQARSKDAAKGGEDDGRQNMHGGLAGARKISTETLRVKRLLTLEQLTLAF